MKIGGFLKQSFIDYPGLISAVIFTSGCNFNCWYCHNAQLINNNHTNISLEQIYETLNERKKFLDGVVISGGEPTLQPDLKDVVLKLKQMNFKVKLDTNGTNPNILQELLDENLLDYVAMDIKTSLKNYNKIASAPKNFDNEIKKSIQILKNSKVEYEFRTTFSPDISISDIQEIANLAKGARNFYLQKYIAENVVICNPNMALILHSKKVYNDALNILKETIPNSKIRGF